MKKWKEQWKELDFDSKFLLIMFVGMSVYAIWMGINDGDGLKVLFGFWGVLFVVFLYTLLFDPDKKG